VVRGGGGLRCVDRVYLVRGGQGLARAGERSHPAGAAVHRHILDRMNAINDSLKKKKKGCHSPMYVYSS